MNYSKTAVQFVCKMAMPLALMFAACSTDNGNAISKTEGDPGVEMGGSSEEPNIVASIRARAYYAPTGSEGVSSDEVSIAVPTNIFYDGGQVFLTELDTMTLEPLDDSAIKASFKGETVDTLTGELIPGDEGMARFDSVSLRSPIVLLKAISGNVSLKTIVDVRETDTFVIDALGHLAASRVQKLVESGMSFTPAKILAETEIANVLGFGLRNPFAADGRADSSVQTLLWRKAFNELVSYDLLDRLKRELGESGAVAGLSEASKKSLTDAVESSPYWRFLSVSRKVLEMRDEKFYQECMLVEDYYASLLTSVFGVEQCSSENEGAFADVQGDLFELKCVSGSWKFVYRKTSRLNIPHTFGTVVDPRDGEEYKTVTIDLGETSQTWMAENLRYATENSDCYMDDSSYCSIYGRLYSPLHDLDSSYRKYTTKEGCVDVKTLEYLNESLSDDTLYWQDWAEEDCDEIFEYGDYRDDDNILWDKVIDSLETINFDVCPEGWRMSKLEDWITLFSYLDDLGMGSALNLLLANYGDPAGFGMDLLADIRGEKGNFAARVKGVGIYQFEPAVKPEGIRGRDVVGTLATTTTRLRKGAFVYNDVRLEGYGAPGYGFIRCVKDE